MEQGALGQARQDKDAKLVMTMLPMRLCVWVWEWRFGFGAASKSKQVCSSLLAGWWSAEVASGDDD